MTEERKFDRIKGMEELGLNVGELEEFEYSKKDAMIKYAKYLIDKFGGLFVRTDFPRHKKGINMNMPLIPNPTIQEFEKFIDKYKDSVTYILLQKRDDEHVIWHGRFWLDESKILYGEVNLTDKGINIRAALSKTENLEKIRCGQGSYDERFIKVRGDIIKTRLEPHTYFDASSYPENGRAVIYYKDISKNH